MNKSSVPFAEDWPVQADDPLEMALDQPFLPTHDALKTCSGNDIHLVKSAANSANRCLAILPGLLALHPPKTTENNHKTTSTADHPDTSEKDTDAKTASKPEAIALGEMKGLLSTDTPTLRMGCMELQGQRVQTTSKFLVLTLQPKKKRVVCKHIFDSVVLFGQAQIKKAPQEAPALPQPWVHYGGSARAGINGTNVAYRLPNVSKEAAVKPRVDPTKPITPKVLEKEKQREELNDDDSESDLSSLKDANDGDDFHMDIVPSSLGRRASSQRKVKAPVKYLERELESSESESEEETPVKRAPRAIKKTTESMAEKDDGVVVPPNSQPSSTPASRHHAKATSNRSSSDSEDDYVPLKRAARDKKTSDGKVDRNAENYAVVVEPRPSSTRAASQRPSVVKSGDKRNDNSKAPKRVASSKKITDESSDEEEVVEVLSSNPSASLRAPRGKQNAADAVRKQKEDSRDEVVVIDGDKSTQSPRKRKSPPVTQSQDDIDDVENDPSVAEDSDDDFEAPMKSSLARKSKSVPDFKAPPAKRPRASSGAMDSLVSTATTPTRRRRRTGTTPSPSKKSASTTFFQSSNDFSF
ncbi:hypothetical protein FisN_12Hh088 [Fistulifera solaris]|uniref:Uncharacterized protein n=1 Tax=Fistulifera solaris TaxID=1519565 RepID=A0A1Z5KQE9_FISSO|nr:hypothetical protein FisN_12Hh088 [Fistulifera solaris]|eukprot:GAX28544.1 hypothetical protein FisN_12Hh088 [Fistulifera solaris]